MILFTPSLVVSRENSCIQPLSVLLHGSEGVVDVLNLNFGELVDFDRGFINDTITCNSLYC